MQMQSLLSSGIGYRVEGAEYRVQGIGRRRVVPDALNKEDDNGDEKYS